MTIGNRIKKRRLDLKMSQTELAEKTKCSKQTIYKYETNIVTNIPYNKIEDIAKILETSPAYLMGWEDVQKNNHNISDIIVRLRTDPDFLSIAETLYTLNSEKIRSIQQMLVAFLK